MPNPNEVVDYSDDDEGGEGEEEVSDEELANPTPLQLNQGTRVEAVQRRSEYFTTCCTLVLLGAMNDVAKDLGERYANRIFRFGPVVVRLAGHERTRIPCLAQVA